MYGERPTKPCSSFRRDCSSSWTGSWPVRMLDAGTSHVLAWISLRWSLGHACFSLFAPAPCPCRALENRLEGRRMSINCWNDGELADAMFDLRTVGGLRPALHVHVGCPSLKKGGESIQACALSLSFLLLFFIPQHGPVRYLVSILFVLVHVSGRYGAEAKRIPFLVFWMIKAIKEIQTCNIKRATNLFSPTRGHRERWPNSVAGAPYTEPNSIVEIPHQCPVLELL